MMLRPELALFIARNYLRLRRPAAPSLALQEALGWIARAQDAGQDRGVSHSYELGRGWLPSYPETTGYIVPTLLNCARVSESTETRSRALEMADWEMEIQFPEGGIRGSVTNRPSLGPVVFNTGQVVFGLVAAYRETHHDAYRASAERAVRWMIEQLGDAATWNTHGNMGRPLSHTYNVRVTWAILEYLNVCPDARVRELMQRNIAWVLEQEKAPGWFGRNCLNDEEHPLLHTIAYTAQGLLESGVRLDDAQAIVAARRTAESLLPCLRKNGSLAGRFDMRWQEAADWVCLTGVAQMSIVWSRFADLTGETRFAEARALANSYLRSVQNVSTRHPGWRGGLAGSEPIWGDYCRNRFPNWATKFFIDALLLEQHPDLARSPNYYPG